MLRTSPALQIWPFLKERALIDVRRLKQIERKIARLLSPCLFGHGHTIRTRDGEGHLALQCMECGQVTRVLDQPAIKGPLLHAEPVKGAPQLAARRMVTHERSYPRSA